MFTQKSCPEQRLEKPGEKREEHEYRRMRRHLHSDPYFISILSIRILIIQRLLLLLLMQFNSWFMLMHTALTPAGVSSRYVCVFWMFVNKFLIPDARHLNPIDMSWCCCMHVSAVMVQQQPTLWLPYFRWMHAFHSFPCRKSEWIPMEKIFCFAVRVFLPQRLSVCVFHQRRKKVNHFIALWTHV